MQNSLDQRRIEGHIVNHQQPQLRVLLPRNLGCVFNAARQAIGKKKDCPGSFNNKMSIDLNYCSMRYLNHKAFSSTENKVVRSVCSGSSQYCSPVGRLKSKDER